ncbi:hypothetical protein [Agitococcus lubricus]|uniref:Uncharacterized protein n=1 Tax=Agitococcus lubricus TaxID=1077255 RepID=A0A2T5J231_9GAMM|nr:hypothetical protein [Agitococcus lubricus]PTQ90458.1 hypothetical protein C8N29_103211 [Agitococcus lubricus]
MKKILLLCVLGGLLAACNDNDSEPMTKGNVTKPAQDSFTTTVQAQATSSPEDTEPVDIEAIALSSAEDTEPVSIQ